MGVKDVQEGPLGSLWRSFWGSRGTERIPRGPKRVPEGPKMSPRTGPVGSKTCKPFERELNVPKSTKNTFCTGQKCPRGSFGVALEIKEGPRGSQEIPRGS